MHYVHDITGKQIVLMHAWCASCHRQADNARGSHKVHCDTGKHKFSFAMVSNTHKQTPTYLYNCTEALSLLFRVVDMQSLFSSSNQHAAVRAPGHRCDQRLMTEVRSDRHKAAAQGPCVQLTLLRNHCTKVVDHGRPAELHTQQECSSSAQRQWSTGNQQKCTHTRAQAVSKASGPLATNRAAHTENLILVVAVTGKHPVGVSCDISRVAHIEMQSWRLQSQGEVPYSLGLFCDHQEHNALGPGTSSN